MIPEDAKYKILQIHFDLIGYQMVAQIIGSWRREGERHYVSITNPHSVLMCQRDEAMKRATVNAALTLPDGVGIIWAANILGYKHHGRVTGPTLMLKLCDWGREKRIRHFFYGGSEGVAENLAQNLSRRFPELEVVGAFCPPFRPMTEQEDREVIAKINYSKPDILWIGLGAPKQEKWMLEHLGKVTATAMIGVGAAFDFHSGNAKWAPAWVRKYGMEWLYRTISEPRRIGPKAVDNIIFGMRIITQYFLIKAATDTE